MKFLAAENDMMSSKIAELQSEYHQAAQIVSAFKDRLSISSSQNLRLHVRLAFMKASLKRVWLSHARGTCYESPLLLLHIFDLPSQAVIVLMQMLF